MGLSARNLRDLLDALEIGVCLLDGAGRVLYANATLTRLFPRMAGGTEGRPLGEAFPELGGALDWGSAARSAVERGRTMRLVRQPLLADRHYDVALGPVRLEGATERAALLTVVDVSDAVHIEARLLRQARTQAIANLGDSVAHEIRNPLNSIHMNVQLLREWLQQEPVDRASVDRTAETVQREIRRLDRVVRDFVQYSRPPALALAAASVNNVTRAALDTLDAQIRSKKLSVEADLQSARPVMMDRDRLQRAIYNVLLNAVQVLPEGGTISCRSRDEERHCLLEIADDGPGLDLTKATHLFDLFYTTKPGGTGLGLPIANRIVEEHGGRMAVASTPGGGATFAFFLPYEGPPEPRAEGPTAVPVRPESGRST